MQLAIARPVLQSLQPPEKGRCAPLHWGQQEYASRPFLEPGSGINSDDAACPGNGMQMCPWCALQVGLWPWPAERFLYSLACAHSALHC